LQIHGVVHVGVVAKNVKLKPFSVGAKLWALQMLLIIEQQIVHGPKPALTPCSLRSNRRREGIRMHLLKGKIAPYESYEAGEALKQ
jgi:hypothetical protein